MSKKLFASTAVVLSTLAVSTFTGASPAQADTRYGCNYPRVCLYLNASDWTAERPTASYQDVTTGWQTLGSQGRGAAYTFNSRNDDIAYFHFTNGREVCVNPDRPLYLDQYGTVDKIRISTSSSC